MELQDLMRINLNTFIYLFIFYIRLGAMMQATSGPMFEEVQLWSRNDKAAKGSEVYLLRQLRES